MKSFILLIIVIGSMFLFINPTEARMTTTRGGWFACITEGMLNQALDHVKAGDEAAYQQLISAKVCIETEHGVRAEIVNRSEDKWETIEIRIHGRAGTVWTFIEAVYAEY